MRAVPILLGLLMPCCEAPQRHALAPVQATSAQPLVNAAPPRSVLLLPDGNPTLRLSRFAPTIVITPDGKRVAGVARREIFLWDAVTGHILHRWPLEADSLQFLADGRLLATANDKLTLLGEDGAAVVVDDGRGWALASRDGAWIATESRRDLVLIAAPPKQMRVVLASKLWSFQSMAFAPDASRFCLLTNAASDDLPAGDTRILVFDRSANDVWGKALTRTIPGARQGNVSVMLSRDVLLVDDSTVDLTTGKVTALDGPWLHLVSTDASAVLLWNGTGVKHWWAPVADGRLGPQTFVERPPEARDRGHAVAVSARGHVVYCTEERCVVAPPPHLAPISAL